MTKLIGSVLAVMRAAWRRKLVRLLIAVLVIWAAQYVTCHYILQPLRCVDPQGNCTPP